MASALFWFSTFVLAGLILQAKGLECNEENTLRCLNKDGCYNLKHRCDGLLDCKDATDESNCTYPDVTKHLISGTSSGGNGNLAWLVTPIIFCLGVVYGIYKCCKEGVCKIRQLRRRRRELEAHGDYFALDQVSFYSMAQFPLSHAVNPNDIRNQPGHRHLLVVHNQCFSVAVEDMRQQLLSPNGQQQNPISPPSYAEAIAANSTQRLLSPNGQQQNPISPPSYAEAIAANSTQRDTDLPPYTEAIENTNSTGSHQISAPESNTPDIWTDDDIDESNSASMSLLGNSNSRRRRHFSSPNEGLGMRWRRLSNPSEGAKKQGGGKIRSRHFSSPDYVSRRGSNGALEKKLTKSDSKEELATEIENRNRSNSVNLNPSTSGSYRLNRTRHLSSIDDSSQEDSINLGRVRHFSSPNQR